MESEKPEHSFVTKNSFKSKKEYINLYKRKIFFNSNTKTIKLKNLYINEKEISSISNIF